MVLKTFYIILSIIAVTGFIYFAIGLYLYFNQSRYVYFPSTEIASTPGDTGINYEEVSFKTSDGIKLYGWFIKGGSKTVLIFHGNGGNISYCLDLAEIFYEMDLSVFLIDYRGYGKSEGIPTENGTYLDADAAWQYLINEKRARPEDIIIFGKSLGGPIAAYLASKKNPGKLIIDSSFTSIKDVGAELYPILPVRKFFKFNYSTTEYIKNINCPVLVIHSRNDEYIPFKHGEKIFETAHEPKYFLEISGDHNSSFIQSSETYIEGIRSFILKN